MYLGAKRRYINTLPFLPFRNNQLHVKLDVKPKNDSTIHNDHSTLRCAVTTGVFLATVLFALGTQ